MTVFPLEFCRVSRRHERGLACFFEALTAHGDDRWFHPHPFTAQYASYLAAYQGRDLFYVAIQGEAVQAYGMLRGWDEGYDIPSLGIAVHPDARGVGLARTFMQFLHCAARRQGAPRVRLKVFRENTSARHLYESLGYRLQPDSHDQMVGFFDCARPAA